MTTKKRIQIIEKIKKHFKKEWLLIKPTKVDSIKGPVKGILLAHSKSKDEIYHLAKKNKGHIYITFSENKLPKGFAVAFYGKV